MQLRIGIVGGSGLEDPSLFTPEKEWLPDTPYGTPSSALRQGVMEGISVVFLSRHGHDHLITPSQINYRANIFALKQAGCSHILASAACGSLRRENAPGCLVVPDQLIDFTKQRAATFFDDGTATVNNIHTPMAEPFDKSLRSLLVQSGNNAGFAPYDGGTLVTIEGPRFSTRAESRMFRSWGGDLVNMTVATEAVLANELRIPYAVLAMVTDYDSWNEEDPPLEIQEILDILAKNVEKVAVTLRKTLQQIGKH